MCQMSFIADNKHVFNFYHNLYINYEEKVKFVAVYTQPSQSLNNLDQAPATRGPCKFFLWPSKNVS